MSHSNRFFKTLSMILTGALAAVVCGCAPVVLPPTQHAPSTPAQVKIYQKQPAKYEALGNISVAITAEIKWDDQGQSAPAFEAFKAKAAAMGANGVLLVMPSGSFDFIATTGYRGAWYQVPLKREPKSAVAQAIFVISE